MRAANGEDWTPAAASHARVVARLRHRGHKLEEIREATKQGRLAYGFLEDMFPDSQGTRTLEDAVEATGLQPALIERFWTSLGLPGQGLENLTEDDIQALRYAASVLASGFPLVAFLQLARVYEQALARIADAEVRLFHIYVHEPLIREGLPGLQIAEEMEHLARDLLPLASPLMGFVHQRFLSHYIEQDVVGHMEIEMDPDADLGRVRVAIAFCDLAGYTRYTEEGPSPTGRWATSCCSPSGPSRASASTTAQRCTATATTSGGRSTCPPGSSRAPAGARFW